MGFCPLWHSLSWAHWFRLQWDFLIWERLLNSSWRNLSRNLGRLTPRLYISNPNRPISLTLRHIMMLPRLATLCNVVTQTLSMLLIVVILQSMEENLSSTSEDRNKKWRSGAAMVATNSTKWLDILFSLPTSPHMSACRMPDSEVAGQILSEGTSWIFSIACISSIFKKESYFLVTQMKIWFPQSFTCQRKIEEISVIIKTTSRH